MLKHGLKELDTGFGHYFGHATISPHSLVPRIVLSTFDYVGNSLSWNFSSSEMIYGIICYICYVTLSLRYGTITVETILIILLFS
jgi:hypothetical protein